MIGKKDLVIAVLATFCLTATLFMVLPTRSQYDPWIDMNDDGVIDSTDLGMLGNGWGTYGDPAKYVNIASPVDGQGSVNVNITGHATKFLTPASSYELASGSTWNSGMIPVDGYSKVSVNVYMNTNTNVYRLYSSDGNHIFLVEFIQNFNSFVCKTYDVMNSYIYIYIYNGSPGIVYLWVEVYLVA